MTLQQELKDKLVPNEDALHLFWQYTTINNKKVKTFTVVCDCGNNKLLVAKNGLRCMVCQKFHSHTNFAKLKRKARHAAMWDTGQIEQIPQPMAEAQQRYNAQRQFRKKILLK